VSCGGAYGYHAWEVKIGSLTKGVLLVGNCTIAILIPSTNAITAISSCPSAIRTSHLDHKTLGLQPHFPCLSAARVYTASDLCGSVSYRLVHCGPCYYQRNNLWSTRRAGSSLVHGRYGWEKVRQPHGCDSAPECYFRGCQRFARFVPPTSAFAPHLEA
jgi:hypothetical protein